MTAGYPTREDTVPLLLALQAGGADVVELGVPFTDPQADGTTIQKASEVGVGVWGFRGVVWLGWDRWKMVDITDFFFFIFASVCVWCLFIAGGAPEQDQAAGLPQLHQGGACAGPDHPRRAHGCVVFAN